MNNPYQAPAANVHDYPGAALDQPYEPRIFSTQGRIGRLRYFAYSFVVQIVLIMLAGLLAALIIPAMARGAASPLKTGALVLLIYLPVLVGLLIMAKRRLHDLNLSGWISLLVLVPLVNIILGFVLMFWPGNKGANRFGPPPVPNSTAVVVFGLILPLAFMGMLAAVAIPTYQQYAARLHAVPVPPPQDLGAHP